MTETLTDVLANYYRRQEPLGDENKDEFVSRITALSEVWGQRQRDNFVFMAISALLILALVLLLGEHTVVRGILVGSGGGGFVFFTVYFYKISTETARIRTVLVLAKYSEPASLQRTIDSVFERDKSFESLIQAATSIFCKGR